MTDIENIEVEPKHISILVPTYNRHQFLPLFTFNILHMNYPKPLLELLIYDDGDDSFIKDVNEYQKHISPIKLKIHKTNCRKTIGEKRNWLCKNAQHKIMCFMDDDDIYHPNYIVYSLHTLLKHKAGLVGCNQMVFCYPKLDFKLTAINCEKKFQIHEATMMFTKKYVRSMNGFTKSSRGEGLGFIQDRDKGVELTDIQQIMICVAHDGNSVDKEMFNQDRLDMKQNLLDGPHKEIIKHILQIKN